MSRAINPSVLALVLPFVLAGESRADFMFRTASGVGPGQQIIVVIVDSIGGAAVSANVSDYSAAISSAASGISYQGGSIGSWSILGSTAGTSAATALFTSCLHVYDIRGLLSPSGQSYLTRGRTPLFDQKGLLASDPFVFAGLTFTASPAGDPLGSAGVPRMRPEYPSLPTAPVLRLAPSARDFP